MKEELNKKDVNNVTETEYAELLRVAKLQIHSTRNALAFQLNSSVCSSYWSLGKLLHERKIEGGYGSNVINRLSIDLKDEFPDMGLSPRNLWNMKLFFERYQYSDKKLLQAVAVLPWGHNLLLINKKLSDDEVFYYASETLKNGWKRELLLDAVKMNCFEIHKNEFKNNNFELTLPDNQAVLANEIIKDTYNLGFIGATKPLAEIELEKRLVEKVKSFMMELGTGFTFIGNQHRLVYNDKEYFVDMLFFNRRLQCLVAIELKIGEFKSEYIGKMNMYLSLLDKLEKGENEKQSIGLILCANKDHLDVEMALQDINKPIAVSEYNLILPLDKLKALKFT